MNRWRAIRQSRFVARPRLGPLRLWLEVNAYAIPLPRLHLDFNECEVSVGVTLCDALNDPAACVALDLKLPATLADLLLCVWPHVAPGERRRALERVFADIAVGKAKPHRNPPEDSP